MPITDIYSGLETDVLQRKICLIGANAVGKTSLVRRCVESTFSESYLATVGVKVDKANLTSTDYTLTAQLGSAPASGVAWKLNGSTLSDSAATTLTSTGTYGSTGSYSWDIVVADSAAAAAIDNAVDFTATSN